MSTHRRGRAMGGQFHVIALGGPDGAVDAAVDELHRLERRWTRFDPASELSRLNAAGGAPCVVSSETAALVDHACVAWARSSGRFDPTIHDRLVSLGYDRDLDLVRHRPLAPGSSRGRLVAEHGIDRTADPSAVPSPGCDGIEVDVASGLVRLPPGVRIDPGGIGKGLAADLLAAALIDAGCPGVLVNLGGDLRASGDAPDGGWRVGVEGPSGRIVETVTLHRGALATSGLHKRRWMSVDGVVHHLLDPRSGEPCRSPWTTITAVADEAWWAEALTKSAFLTPTEGWPTLPAADAFVAVDTAERMHRWARHGGGPSRVVGDER